MRGLKKDVQKNINFSFKIIASIILITSFVSGESLAFSGPGLGTSDNPFLINNCTELQSMNDNLTASYELTRNIDCSGISFSPIGNLTNAFTGTLDGKGYSVDNLNISDSGSDYVGLFGNLYSATISYLKITTATITGANQVGTLAGNSTNSTLSYIRVHNTNITASGDNVGGLIGELGGSGLEYSDANNVLVNGVSKIGGLVGWAVGGSAVYDSYAEGYVGASGDNVGGLVGQVGNGPTIVGNTYSYDNVVDPNGHNVGGLVGQLTSNASVSNSFTLSPTDITSDSATSGGAFGVQLGNISNIWFDLIASGYSNCVGSGDSSGCSSTSDPSLYSDNSSIQPLNNWDFSNTWTVVNSGHGLPDLQDFSNWGPNGGPNNNDANGDGIDDSFQPNVNSLQNDTGIWSVIVVPIDSGCVIQRPEWIKPDANDLGYIRQLGTMTSFTLYCPQQGQTVPVTIIYDKKYDTTGWVLREYNITTKEYSIVPNAIFGNQTIGGVVKTTVTYNLTDGGTLDSDGVANGVIIDTVAPAISTVVNPSENKAPDTGYGKPNSSNTTNIFIAFAVIILMFKSIVYLKHRRKI